MPSTISAGTTAGTAIAIAGDTTGNLAFQTNGTTTAMTINTSQGVSVLNCLGVGNATPSTSGAGITFPATQSASTDANTLDDYEEGTWTPVIDSETAGTSRATTVNSARYTKIGNLVQAQCFISLGTLGSGGSGVWVINGLPFTVAGSSAYTSGSINYWQGLNANLIAMGCYADAGFSRLKVTGSAAATTNFTELTFSTYAKASMSMIITITYQV